MKATELLNNIKSLLGVELSDIELAQLKLENGTILESDSFEKGNEVFIVTDDERVALPIGEYELEDGRVLSIKEEGMIEDIKAEEHEEKKDEKMQYVTKDELRKEMENLASHLKDEIKKMMEHKDEKEDKEKEEMSSQVGLAVTEILEKEELSKPAVEPIKHNPEIEEKVKFQFAQNRRQGTLDRVMNNILKIKK
tara:strand:+ start:5995 stop:6579 length:585 start_codon:yes stop_codon:yes gene_type:complete